MTVKLTLWAPASSAFYFRQPRVDASDIWLSFYSNSIAVFISKERFPVYISDLKSNGVEEESTCGLWYQKW